MNLYVVPACLRIAHDTLPAFLASMLHSPPASPRLAAGPYPPLKTRLRKLEVSTKLTGKANKI